MKTINQLHHLNIPPNAIITPIEQGVARADWILKKQAQSAYVIHTEQGWVSAPSFELAINRKVLSRLQLPYQPAA
jgi:hypothetical protein